jgi:hypothetical protein
MSTVVTPASAVQRLRLFELPPELRLDIYGYVFTGSYFPALQLKWNPDPFADIERAIHNP